MGAKKQVSWSQTVLQHEDKKREIKAEALADETRALGFDLNNQVTTTTDTSSATLCMCMYTCCTLTLCYVKKVGTTNEKAT